MKNLPPSKITCAAYMEPLRPQFWSGVNAGVLKKMVSTISIFIDSFLYEIMNISRLVLCLELLICHKVVIKFKFNVISTNFINCKVF